MKVINKSLIAISCALLVMVSTTGCENMRGRDVGTVVGVGSGAVIGSAIGGSGAGGAIGTIGGAAVGGVVGHEIGRSAEKKKVRRQN